MGLFGEEQFVGVFESAGGFGLGVPVDGVEDLVRSDWKPRGTCSHNELFEVA